jgi:uncharacterized membrane protein
LGYFAERHSFTGADRVMAAAGSTPGEAPMHMTDTAAQPRRHVRPLHPPFTHFPIAAYVMAAAFDVISVIGGRRHQWAGQLWHAGTFVLIAGLVLCLVTMLTGFADLVRFGERRPAAVKVMAIHVCVMASVFMLGVGDLALRLSGYHQQSTPPPVLILTVLAAIGVCTGGFFGGTLVYKHGTGVAVGTGAAGAGQPGAGPDSNQPPRPVIIRRADDAVRRRARRP